MKPDDVIKPDITKARERATTALNFLQPLLQEMDQKSNLYHDCTRLVGNLKGYLGYTNEELASKKFFFSSINEAEVICEAIRFGAFVAYQNTHWLDG